MKKSNVFLAKSCRIFNKIRNKKIQKKRIMSVISIIVLIAFLNMIVGCHYYYKVGTGYNVPSERIVEMKNKNKYFILHMEQKVWHFNDLKVKGDTLFGTINELSYLPMEYRHYLHMKYKTTDPQRVNRYKINSSIDESAVLDEVHIYITDYVKKEDSEISVSLNAIQKIEIYDPAVGATIGSWVFGALAGTAIACAALLIIVMLTKTSCPFIYAYNGEFYTFSGEIYSGAILPPLERHDYLPLPNLRAINGEYKVKMANEVHEIQHTNLTELLVFDHPEDSKVLVDKYGIYFTLTDLQPPFEATSLKGKDILYRIDKEDSLSYFGDELGKDQVLTDGIIMKFERPELTNSAKLVIRAKNTFWLDYVFSRVHELFGEAYNNWMEKRKTGSEKKMRNWTLSQNIPISLYIEKNGQWKFVDYYHIVGPMASKKDILSIDLSGIVQDTVTIKLEFGFFFWEIDYAGIDFTDNITAKKKIVPLESATDNEGDDVKDLLLNDDNEYFIQPEIGNEVILTFTVPEISDINRTLILHSKGHYQILRDQEGKMNKKYLRSFRKPGRFSRFSEELLLQKCSLQDNY